MSTTEIIFRWVSSAKKQQHFVSQWNILYPWWGKEEKDMRECSDPQMDLDDLIFEEGAGGPSER